jgi:hypothetical protein
MTSVPANGRLGAVSCSRGSIGLDWGQYDVTWVSEDDVIAARDDGVAELARNQRRIVRKLGKYATIRVDPETCIYKIKYVCLMSQSWWDNKDA